MLAFSLVYGTGKKSRVSPAAARPVLVRQRYPDVGSYLSNAPETTTEAELARMRGMRWPVEVTFEQGKGDVGMADDEVRSWQGWHHHRVMVRLAHHCLVWVRREWKERAAALTLNQVRLLRTSVVPRAAFDAERALFLVQ